MLAAKYLGGPFDGMTKIVNVHESDYIVPMDEKGKVARYRSSSIHSTGMVSSSELGECNCDIVEYSFVGYIDTSNLVPVDEDDVHPDGLPYSEHFQHQCNQCSAVLGFIPKDEKYDIWVIAAHPWKAKCAECKGYFRTKWVYIPQRAK